ncbi:hypothetical protein JL720_5393 [Aureococcus anophagefferens]|nr:hypothetical protein JL720_5393 [Aureococcus anophagefferens]
MGPPSSPVPAPPPASADAAAVRAYATTLKDLGNDRFAAGDDDSASALYGKALDACHGSMGDLRCAALCNRAACHLRAKRWRACVADCDAALALDGARAKALYRRARAAEGLGDLAAAARDYKAFLVLEPRHKDATERARKRAPRRAPRLARRLRRDVRRRPVVQGRAPAPARRAGAARDRAGAGELAAASGRGAVLVLPGFVDAAEAARIVAAASERGAMGPAREERRRRRRRRWTNTCGADGAACPGLVATALALFPAARRTASRSRSSATAPASATTTTTTSSRPDGRWRRAASIFVVLKPRTGGATAFKRLRPRDVRVARAGWRGGGARTSAPATARPRQRGARAGVDIAARPGDGLLWHNVDEWGRRDERVEHAAPRPTQRAGAAAGGAPGAARTAAPRSPAPRRRARRRRGRQVGRQRLARGRKG